MEEVYGTPIKIIHDHKPVRSSYKFFENYNIKCLMNELDLNDKENITSGNKATGKKMNSPMSNYKYIYKIINTSTVLRQSPTSVKKPLQHKLSSIVSLDCIENLNSKFDSAENENLNSNSENIGFTQFIDHMREDVTYADYFVQDENKRLDSEQDIGNTSYFDEKAKKEIFNNMVTKLRDLLN